MLRFRLRGGIPGGDEVSLLFRFTSCHRATVGDSSEHKEEATHAIQDNSDTPVRVKGRLLAAQLSHLAHEEDVATDKVVKVGRCDARSG